MDSNTFSWTAAPAAVGWQIGLLYLQLGQPLNGLEWPQDPEDPQGLNGVDVLAFRPSVQIEITVSLGDVVELSHLNPFMPTCSKKSCLQCIRCMYMEEPVDGLLVESMRVTLFYRNMLQYRTTFVQRWKFIVASGKLEKSREEMLLFSWSLQLHSVLYFSFILPFILSFFLSSILPPSLPSFFIISYSFENQFSSNNFTNFFNHCCFF